MAFQKLISKIGNTISSRASKERPYDLWIKKNEPDRHQLKAMGHDSKSWSYRPLVSIVTPVYNPVKYDITRCIQSVIDQVYEKWELCIVDGGSDKSYVKKIIERYAEKDSRIKFVSLSQNKGIAGNSNEALKLATGEYIGFLDHDDMLAPFALFEVVKLLNKDASIDFMYSDEDKTPADGENRYAPFFKPDWSPDTFLSYNYLCHFAVIRKAVIEKAGGFREGYDGSQDYDLFLRVVQNTNKIRRIPKVLYHWRAASGSASAALMAKPYALDAAKTAIAGYLKGRGVDAEVSDGLFPTSYRVRYKIRPSQKVSIIIPTKDKVQLLRQCVTSIIEKTDYKDYEMLIVDNQSVEKETVEYFELLGENPPVSPFYKGGINRVGRDETGRIRVISYDKPFNFSAINNFAAQSSDAEILLFLNNDTEVISSEWLSAMIEFEQREDVGAVGAKLYYPNDTIQHAGVIVGLRGLAAHAHKDFPRKSNGYYGRLNVIQNLSAVTGACMMVRKKVFDEVGGFEERLSHAFNDVDLCLKIREKGYLIVFTPYAELYHYDSASGASKGHEETPTPEGKERFAREKEFMLNKWKDVLASGDPYYNPNLTLEKWDFSINYNHHP
ncbi:MAG: hypothetical protein A2W23_00635 [Planctomycetes bacterium RBG_16_43_13]|nr:MAG: hypothetical protein A2W23_00635 [Planctomycetes bacterium RBG_16_43_13]